MQPQEDENPVEQAATKEKQPTRKDDLSPIHDTKAVGTTGGDQRQNEEEAAIPAEEKASTDHTKQGK